MTIPLAPDLPTFAAPLAVAAPAAALALAAAARCVFHALAGASSREPEEMADALSPEARALLDRCHADLPRESLVDYHVHLVGLGEDGSGCYVDPRMRSWRHPVRRLRYLAYRSAARIRDEALAESQYTARLAALARAHAGRFLVLAFDEHRGPDGRLRREKTEFHVPNDHALRVAEEHRGLFAAACSVHPLRPGAVEELDRCADRGARVVKWLPNAMGIDPSDPRIRPFYVRMRERGMALLSHAGEEKAVHAEEDQRLGNPLLLRAALECGVRTIVAHCAGLGEDEDLDDPRRPRVASWRLFLRMMDDPRWDGLLFGDVSAATQANRTPEPLRTLLLRPDLHGRLVNGSDYPLPAVNVVIRTGKFESLGWITSDERRALNEIYDFHPLAFDYALKRTLCVRDAEGHEHRFAPSVFCEHPDLPV